jgi:hypothetical protein
VIIAGAIGESMCEEASVPLLPPPGFEDDEPQAARARARARHFIRRSVSEVGAEVADCD